MKAISLWQPWASLIACGAKPYETRSWAPPFDLVGKRIAIHAAKKIDKGAAEFAEELMYGQHKTGGHELADKLAATMCFTPDDMMAKFGRAAMPVGGVVCTGVLMAAFRLGEPAGETDGRGARVVRSMTSRPVPPCFTVRYDDFGDYAPGRWAWLLTDIKAMDPAVPAVGRQGFFELPQGWMTGSTLPHGEAERPDLFTTTGPIVDDDDEEGEGDGHNRREGRVR